MKCIRCGNELVENALFCNKCGAPQEQNTQSVDSKNESVIENQQSDLSNSTNSTCVAAIVDNNTVKKVKDKKQVVKIIVPIVAVIVLIVVSLGVFSFVNYKSHQPYKEVLEDLEKGRFIYYKEYDEISCFEFSEYNGKSNFLKRILNIRDNYEIQLSPKIYFLYDEDELEDYEEITDLIAEEEDEEIYNEIPNICELVIEDNGDVKIVFDNETLFNINLDDDKNIVSVTYNEGEKEYKNTNIDKELADKYSNVLLEYADYMARDFKSSNVLTIAEVAPLYYGNYSIGTIASFIRDRVDNPEVTIKPDRIDENIYFIIVSGKCLFTIDRYDPLYTQQATVIFCYDKEQNECRVYRDNNRVVEMYFCSMLY